MANSCELVAFFAKLIFRIWNNFIAYICKNLRKMAALIIESKNPENLKILALLAKKLGDKVKSISLDDTEDMLFGEMMQKDETGKYVSKDVLFKKLSGK